MGAYEGVEIAELVGLYILQSIKTELTNVNTGLYPDDGLAVIKGTGKVPLFPVRHHQNLPVLRHKNHCATKSEERRLP